MRRYCQRHSLDVAPRSVTSWTRFDHRRTRRRCPMCGNTPSAFDRPAGYRPSPELVSQIVASLERLRKTYPERVPISLFRAGLANVPPALLAPKSCAISRADPAAVFRRTTHTGCYTLWRCLQASCLATVCSRSVRDQSQRPEGKPG